MKKVKGLLAVLIAVVMMVTAVIPAFAGEEEVRAVADGVMYFGMSYENWFEGSGTCFLINEDTIITANHCVSFTKQMYDAFNYYTGASKKEVDKGFEYTVTISRDFKITAELINSSENMDFAILKLSQPLNNRKPLTLRDSRDVKAAETVWTVGFPGVKQADAETANYYNKNDIIFQSSTINRTQYTEDKEFKDSITGTVYHFVGDTLLTSVGSSYSGNSGGPLVDNSGNVIGIVTGGSDSAKYSSAISQVMEILDSLGTEYIKAGAVPADDDQNKEDAEINYSALQSSISTAESKNEKEYTPESYQKLSTAIAAAKTALNAKTQEEVDKAKSDLDSAVNALQAKPKVNGALIGIIAGAAVIIALVVVLIVVLGKKKGAAPEKAPEKAVPVQNKPVSSIPSVPNAPAEGSEGTTVLSSNASDPNATTVLSGNQSIARLVRLSNNETINITKPYFKIGKDASRVDYCIKGNPAVSRFHASIVAKNGQFFIVDNSTTNHTYVNDSMLPANVETQISNGAKIRLADEKFEFKI